MNKRSLKNINTMEELKDKIKEKDYQKQETETLMKELSTLQTQKENYEEQLEMYKEDKEQTEKLYEIMLEDNDFKKVEPDYEHEKDPRWWDLKQKQQEQQRDQKLNQLSHDIDQQKQLVEYVDYNINFIVQILQNRGDLDE